MISATQLLRHVPGDSVVHRADVRTKVLVLTVIVFVVSFDPAWSSIAALWVGVVGAFVAARLPIRSLPSVPRILRWSIGLSLLLGVLAGGEPFVALGPVELGVGGLLVELRFFALSIGLLGLTLLLGWTSPLGDLPDAAAWMLSPLRRIGVPVDDVVAGLGLAVRALPLMADELATMRSLWGLRPRGSTPRLVAVFDFAATATTSATRRAIELGETMANRGGVGAPARPARWSWADLVVGLVGAALVGAVVRLG